MKNLIYTLSRLKNGENDCCMTSHNLFTNLLIISFYFYAKNATAEEVQKQTAAQKTRRCSFSLRAQATTSLPYKL